MSPSKFAVPSLILLLALGSCASISAGSDIPPRARHFVSENYPQAELVEWAGWGDGYVVSFYDQASGHSTEITFDERGRWTETTIGIDTEALPAVILQYLERQFADYYATAYRLLSPGMERYGLTVDTPTHIYTLIFSPEGRLLEREEEGLDAD